MRLSRQDKDRRTLLIINAVKLAEINTYNQDGSSQPVIHNVVVHATNATLPNTITMADYQDLVNRVTVLENA